MQHTTMGGHVMENMAVPEHVPLPLLISFAPLMYPLNI